MLPFCVNIGFPLFYSQTQTKCTTFPTNYYLKYQTNIQQKKILCTLYRKTSILPLNRKTGILN